MSDTNEHRLSLSYQIRRAIKAEDALHVAKQEIANLNELLNASYVDPTGESGLSALLKKVFWPSKLDKEILELVASQAIELEELGTEVTCIPDMREEIVYLKAQLAAQQAQQAFSGCACCWDADEKRVATCVRHQGWLDVVSEWAERAKAAESKQAQPERAPLSCTWTQEDDFDMPGVYHTSCGEMWSFTEGGIKENNTKFCPHCGGGIKQGGQQ